MIKPFVNTCWSCFVWGAGVLVVVALAVGAYYVVHVDDELRRQVEKMLAEHYKHLDVQVGSARLIEGEGIEIRDLSLSERDQPVGQAMLVIDELFLACPVQLKELLGGLPPVTRVVLRRPHVRARLGKGNRWNLASLWPLPSKNARPAETVVQDATIEFFANPQRPEQRLLLKELNCRLTPRFAGAASASPVTFEFGLAAVGELFNAVTFHGKFVPAAGELSGRGEVQEIKLSQSHWRALPDSIASALVELEHLSGSCEVTSFRARTTGDAAGPQFEARLKLTDLELRHAKLPDRIHNANASATINTVGIRVDRFSGQFAEGQLSLTAQRQGWTATAPVSLVGNAQQIHVRPEHYPRLPPQLHLLWHKYHPQGVIDVTRCQAQFDGRAWHKQIDIACRNVSLLAEKFSYPVHHVTGTVSVRPHETAADHLRTTLELTGKIQGDRDVHIRGDLLKSTAGTWGWVSAAGKQIAVDQELIAAVPGAAQQFLHELRPSGSFDIHWTSTRHDPHQQTPDTSLDLTVHNGSVNYARFAYPLNNVRGRVRAKNRSWEFVDFTATNGKGLVRCSGTLELPPPENGSTPPGAKLSLTFTGQQIEMQSQLYNALQPNVQRAWGLLRPSGRINLTASYNQSLGVTPPDVKLTISPDAQTLSIEPTFFPYRFDRLQGVLTVGSGSGSFTQMRAMHGPTTIIADGSFIFSSDDKWSVDLSNVSVDRLIVDRALLTALPPGVRNLLVKIRPQGQFAMDRGHFLFDKTGPQSPMSTQWSSRLDAHQATLDCGVLFEDVSGSAQLSGTSQGETVTARGELNLDVARFKRLVFENVRGPLRANGDRLWLGSGAAADSAGKPRRVTANAYGGKLAADVDVALGARPAFTLQADYQGGDLGRLMADIEPANRQAKGQIYGTLALQGRAASLDSLRGNGRVSLREAELYDLPQIIRLFKVLRGKEPDRTAFTQADARFDISTGQIYFNDLHLSGDALTLMGGGTVGFDKQLNLAFSSILGRDDVPLAALRRLVKQASSQVMQIHVRGTLADPQFQHEPLPGFNQFLRQIHEEIDPQARRNRAVRRR